MNAYASVARSARMVHALRPWVLYLCMVALALMAGVMLLMPPHRPHAFAFGFFAAACWALVGSRLLLVQRVLRHSWVPNAGRSIGIALALLALPTMVLPALVLTITHGLTLASLALLLCSVAGLLWALGTRLVVIAALFTFYAVMLVSSLPALAWLRLSGTFQGPALLALTLALAGYLIWLWRTWLERDPADRRPQRPLETRVCSLAGSLDQPSMGLSSRSCSSPGLCGSQPNMACVRQLRWPSGVVPACGPGVRAGASHAGSRIRVRLAFIACAQAPCRLVRHQHHADLSVGGMRRRWRQ